MESKVNRALLLQQFLASFAHARQNAIDDGNFTNAMTHQFFYHLHEDDLHELIESFNSNEFSKYISARYCLD